MEKIIYHNQFASIENDDASKVFEILPNVFRDSRGYFTEVLKSDEAGKNESRPSWMRNQNWIKQVNRSSSSEGTVRGCHAQKGPFCQGKLVEALTEKLYDVIIDGRPNSLTFGRWAVFILDPQMQNKLWVPRGFLHSFVTPLGPKKDFVFQYFCDNVYSHESEFGISPMSVFPRIHEEFKRDSNDPDFKDFTDAISDMSRLNLSEKDLTGISCNDWLIEVAKDYNEHKRLWYCK